MADVTGAISTLPGTTHKLPMGTMCDDHPEVPAYKRVQGETDSMGSEMIDMCEVCYNAHLEFKKQPVMGCCQWCKKGPVEIFPTRDWEEGSHGPVYDVCSPCIGKMHDDINAEHDALFGVSDDDRGDDDLCFEPQAPDTAEKEIDLGFVKVNCRASVGWNRHQDEEVVTFRLSFYSVNMFQAMPLVHFNKERMRTMLEEAIESGYMEVVKTVAPTRTPRFPKHLSKDAVLKVIHLMTSLKKNGQSFAHSDEVLKGIITVLASFVERPYNRFLVPLVKPVVVMPSNRPWPFPNK